MRRILTSIGTFLLCSVMVMAATNPDTHSRGRNNFGHNNGPARVENRPGGNQHQNNNRPGGNQNNNNGFRPGGNQNRPGAPSIQRPPQQRPQPAQRPSQQRPPQMQQPNHGQRPPYAVQAPHRPYMPVNRVWSRPTPPPNWRPYHGAPRFTGILGVVFGTALDVTLNSLINSGYTVANYGPSTIYLNSVPMMNYTWPNATINFVDGAMRGSEFTYSTAGYDMSRYNALYNSLIRQYGYPVSTQNNGGVNVSATWWGYNNGYITLSYFQDYAYNGGLRYYTTLSIGN